MLHRRLLVSVLQAHGCLIAADNELPKGRPNVDAHILEHFPAASASQDTYTLHKFYDMSSDLIKTVFKVRFLHAFMQSCALPDPPCCMRLDQCMPVGTALQVQECSCRLLHPGFWCRQMHQCAVSSWTLAIWLASALVHACKRCSLQLDTLQAVSSVNASVTAWTWA